MRDYYVRGLSGERLRLCYELAPPRVRRYLEAEVAFVLERVRPASVVLELGCGYGRVLKELARRARRVVGIDLSAASMAVAHRAAPGCGLALMDAAALGLADRSFDVVVCIQNGLSAFGADAVVLLSEASRVARPGGTILCSTYSPRFWSERLRWFEIQAENGLVGPIDYEATGDGLIVCRDGFRATTASAEQFRSWAEALGLAATVVEVDGSSLCCEMVTRRDGPSPSL